MLNKIPLSKQGSPEDIANTVLFFLPHTETQHLHVELDLAVLF
jgi:hypothetical protein